MKKKRISLVLLAFDKGIASTVIGPLEIFQYANLLAAEKYPELLSPFFNVKVCSIDGSPVRCSEKVLIEPDCSLDDVKDTDLVLICSPGILTEETWRKHTRLFPKLKDLHEAGSALAGICTGAFFLAETGVLDHRSATTHWNLADSFRERFPLVNLKPDRIITDEGDILCAGGVYSALDLSLYLVEKYSDREIAVLCAKTLIIESGRQSQTRFSIFTFQKQHQDQEILETQNWIEAHYNETFAFETLATDHGMSTRTFKRRFKKATGDTPLSYLQRLRIESARKELEFTNKTIDQISQLVGYEDINFFRTLFKRFLDITPKAYRGKFKFKQETADN